MASAAEFEIVPLGTSLSRKVKLFGWVLCRSIGMELTTVAAGHSFVKGDGVIFWIFGYDVADPPTLDVAVDGEVEASCRTQPWSMEVETSCLAWL